MHKYNIFLNQTRSVLNEFNQIASETEFLTKNSSIQYFTHDTQPFCTNKVI